MKTKESAPTHGAEHEPRQDPNTQTQKRSDTVREFPRRRLWPRVGHPAEDEPSDGKPIADERGAPAPSPLSASGQTLYWALPKSF